MNAISAPPNGRRSADLPACGVPAYLHGLAYVTREMATTNDPRVRKLGAQLLAMQAPTLAAIADARQLMKETKMKKLLKIICLGALGVLSLSTLAAQTVDSSPRAMAVFTVGTLPTASSWANKLALVTDGASAGDCTVGAGSTRVLCVSNGSAWAAVGGSAGGGATITTPAFCPGGCAASYPGNSGSTTNTLNLWLVQISSPMQIAKIVFQPGTASNQAWAIYSVNGASSMKLVTSSSGTGCGGCNYSLALPFTFSTPGSYYLAFCADAATNIAVSGTTWSAPGAGTITSPMVATGANPCAWSGTNPNFPTTTGALTSVNGIGFPYALLTY
jgi:hypothetical protein